MNAVKRWPACAAAGHGPPPWNNGIEAANIWDYTIENSHFTICHPWIMVLMRKSSLNDGFSARFGCRRVSWFHEAKKAFWKLENRAPILKGHNLGSTILEQTHWNVTLLVTYPMVSHQYLNKIGGIPSWIGSTGSCWIGDIPTCSHINWLKEAFCCPWFSHVDCHQFGFVWKRLFSTFINVSSFSHLARVSRAHVQTPPDICCL